MRNRSSQVVAALSILVVSMIGYSSTATSDDSELSSKQYNLVLKRTSIVNNGEAEVLIREILFPGGWLAPKHFHNADLFIYVIEGEFEVTMDHNGRVVYSAGQALEMRANTTMDARNPSATNSLKLAVFQVGAADSPFVVPVE